jgi:hypothetical protein
MQSLFDLWIEHPHIVKCCWDTTPSEQIRIRKSFYWKHGGSFNGTIDLKQQQLSVNSPPSIKVTSTLNTPLQVVLQHWTSDSQLSSSSMQHHYKHMRLTFCVSQYFKEIWQRIFFFFFYWRNSPQWVRTSPFMKFLDHTHDAPQSVELLWTNEQLVAETST